jgi:hypothetical protein
VRDHDEEHGHDPHSSFNLTISLTVGYRRKRAFAGKWESSLTSIGLLLGGLLVVLLFLYWLLSRLALI